MAELEIKNEIKALGSALLQIGSLLLVSGASTDRIRTTINRISDSFEYNTEVLISHRTIMLNIYDEDSDCLFNSLKRTSAHGVNFRLLSGISRMSWLIAEQNWTIAQINEEVERLENLPQYPRLVILAFVGLAGAAFCRLAGGNFYDMLLVFAGSFCGLFVRQEAAKKRFNYYLCVYFGAFVSSMIAGIALKFNPIKPQEYALATSVLFLIPGVPLINSFSDMIDGNLQNGLIRGINGFIISFSIAMGLLSTMFIYQL